MNFHDYTQFSSLHLYIYTPFFVLFHFFPFSQRSPSLFFFSFAAVFFFVSQITLWYKILMQKLCSPRIKADNQRREWMNGTKIGKKVRMENAKRESELLSWMGNEFFSGFCFSWQRNTNDKFWKFCLAASVAISTYFFFVQPLPLTPSPSSLSVQTLCESFSSSVSNINGCYLLRRSESSSSEDIFKLYFWLSTRLYT